MAKFRMTTTIDREIYEGAKGLLHESGISISSYVQICLKALVDSQEKPMKDMWEGVVKELIRDATKL